MLKVVLSALIITFLGIATFVGISSVVLIATGYLIPYDMQELRVDEGEVTITKADGFMSTTTYSVDRDTGDEKVTEYHYKLFSPSYHYTAVREKACGCVTTIHVDEEGSSRSVFYRNESDTFSLLTGDQFRKSKTVSAASVSQELARARQKLDATKQRFEAVILDATR